MQTAAPSGAPWATPCTPSGQHFQLLDVIEVLLDALLQQSILAADACGSLLQSTIIF